MTPVEFVKKIKNYAVISFFVPLIAINSCLLFYQYMGDLKIFEYPNLNWNQDEHTYTFEEYKLKNDDRESHRFMFCPKYNFLTIYTTIDNQILIVASSTIVAVDGEADHLIVDNLINNNKIKSVTIKKKKY